MKKKNAFQTVIVSRFRLDFLFIYFFFKSLGKCLQNSKTFISFLEAHLNAVSNASWSIIDNAAVARRLTVSLLFYFIFFLLFGFCLFNSCLPTPWKQENSEQFGCSFYSRIGHSLF